MTHFIGTAGDDNLVGTTGNDYFDMSQGGDDTVSGLGGTDTFYYGAAFTANDHIDGGTKGRHHVAQGIVELNGDYSAGVVFGAQTMVNIVTLKLDGGHSYDLTINQTTVSNNQISNQFTVDASTLGAADSLIFDGSADSKAELHIISNAGHADLTGAAFFTEFDMGASLNVGDHLVGHAGVQTEVELSGNYSGGLVLDASMLTNITTLSLIAGTYNLTTADDLVAAGQTFDVAGNGGISVLFDGSAETDGNFRISGVSGTIIGGAGNDQFLNIAGTITSGTGNDTFTNCSGTLHLERSGIIQVNNSGVTSSDTIYMGASLTAADAINGGGGNDTVILDGDYSAGLTLTATTLLNIEVLQLIAGHSYDITANSVTVGNRTSMKIDGSGLGAGDSLTFDGSQEIKGHFTIAGGAGADVLTGGQGGNAIDGGKGQDTITGGLGDDAITGGGGQDTLSGGSNGNDSFVYNAVSDSTGVHFDTVVGFDVTRDNFNVMTGVTGIDAAINGGALSDHHSATFNNELAAAVDAAHLQANHAVLFTPDSGSLAGDVFLVVDQNGIAGYQTNQDLVIEISGSGNIASLSVQNFM